ncbi:hypothetical protein BD289DRAFT_458937 [Coniella lustricola]|uniref:Uncharacterized protein n=1 Tax=Coniella lustricola TaxID=2025994 RepID=A0A2T3AH29_9PEZI|nr:hypothetical protein BD289DRAFT_458937 [Coniella lustricola]
MGDAFYYDSSEEASTQKMDRPPSPESKNGSQANYTVKETPLGTLKYLRIVCVGAGVSGINLLRTLRLNLKHYEAVVYEKNEDVGGTWLENKYPGCRCDIPSHCYQYSWRQKKDWSSFFAPSHEIRDYLCEVCKDEDLLRYIKLSHQVVAAQWHEASGLWHLKIKSLETGEQFDDTANFLINASGILNNWKWPDVDGLDDFKGPLIHTAAWPRDFDYKGKTVAVIGNGASGIQLLPTIQPDVKKLCHIVRTPTWIPPPWRQAQVMAGRGQMIKQVAVDDKENFTSEQIQKFLNDEDFYQNFVKSMEKDTASNFGMFVKDGAIQAVATAKTRDYMQYMLGGDEKLCKIMIPTFPFGTRRVTPAPGYMEAVRKENVEVFGGNIRRFISDGIEMESGDLIKVDAIICATGFDTSFCPRFPIIGRDGDLRETWTQNTPKAYMSVAVKGLPNYFTFLGPNAPISHGSVFTLSEHIAKYITRILKKVQAENIRAVAPLPKAVEDYNEHIAHFMPRMTWAAPGRSWFKAGKEDGPVVAVHPGSRTHFFHMLETFRAEDFEYVWDAQRQNRFGCLGNGFSIKEVEEGWDQSWYLHESAMV